MITCHMIHVKSGVFHSMSSFNENIISQPIEWIRVNRVNDGLSIIVLIEPVPFINETNESIMRPLIMTVIKHTCSRMRP